MSPISGRDREVDAAAAAEECAACWPSPAIANGASVPQRRRPSCPGRRTRAARRCSRRAARRASSEPRSRTCGRPLERRRSGMRAHALSRPKKLATSARAMSCSRGSSANSCCSRNTSTRSISSTCSSSSVESITIADAAGAPAREQRVDVALGADVDAAGRVVEQQDPRLRREPAGDHDLLLVAAAERGDRVARDAPSTIRSRLDVARRRRASRGRAARDQPRRASLRRVGSAKFSRIDSRSKSDSGARSRGT